jgi:hypothetical protein
VKVERKQGRKEGRKEEEEEEKEEAGVDVTELLAFVG